MKIINFLFVCITLNLAITSQSKSLRPKTGKKGPPSQGRQVPKNIIPSRQNIPPPPPSSTEIPPDIQEEKLISDTDVSLSPVTIAPESPPIQPSPNTLPVQQEENAMDGQDKSLAADESLVTDEYLVSETPSDLQEAMLNEPQGYGPPLGRQHPRKGEALIRKLGLTGSGRPKPRKNTFAPPFLQPKLDEIFPSDLLSEMDEIWQELDVDELDETWQVIDVDEAEMIESLNDVTSEIQDVYEAVDDVGDVMEEAIMQEAAIQENYLQDEMIQEADLQDQMASETYVHNV